VHRDRSALSGDIPPTPRETAIIETAMATRVHLPEAYAAARMFFRFDPGFGSELEGARLHWRGSAAPLPVDGLSERKQFDVRARLRNSAGLSEGAYGLAVRWGLPVDTVMDAIAYDTPLQYPVVQILHRQEEPITGTRHVEIRVYSSHVWPIVRGALDGIDWLPRVPWLRSPTDIAWFEDKPEGSRVRASGMDGDVAARTLALHFLIWAAEGRRPTGGGRTWDGAVALWRSVTGLEPGERRPWGRARSQLLRVIFGRLMGPGETLAAIRDARGLDDTAWADRLGVDAQTWHKIRSNHAVPLAAWRQIRQALPEIADDLDSYRECGLLKIGTS
jgi:hypothetical protein